MRSRSFGGITKTKRKLSLELDSVLELSKDNIIGKRKYSRLEDTSILENFSNFHLILERIDLKLIEKGGFSGSNFVALENNLFLSNDFNLSLNNLSLDLKLLEERSLFRIKTSRTSGNGHIIGSNHTRFGRRGSNFGVKDCFNITEVTISKNKINVTPKLGDNLFNIGILNVITFSFFIVFIFRLWFGTSFV